MRAQIRLAWTTLLGRIPHRLPALAASTANHHRSDHPRCTPRRRRRSGASSRLVQRGAFARASYEERVPNKYMRSGSSPPCGHARTAPALANKVSDLVIGGKPVYEKWTVPERAADAPPARRAEAQVRADAGARRVAPVQHEMDCPRTEILAGPGYRTSLRPRRQCAETPVQPQAASSVGSCPQAALHLRLLRPRLSHACCDRNRCVRNAPSASTATRRSARTKRVRRTTLEP